MTTIAAIPAGLVAFFVVILALVTWLGLAALGKRDGFQQHERGDRGHG